MRLRPHNASDGVRGFADLLAQAQPLSCLVVAATAGPLALYGWRLARLFVHASAGLCTTRFLVADLVRTTLREVRSIERILGWGKIGQVLCVAHQIASAVGIARVEGHAGG
jgi:hypothetical protein